jgi:hypothetical protein
MLTPSISYTLLFILTIFILSIKKLDIFEKLGILLLIISLGSLV